MEYSLIEVWPRSSQSFEAISNISQHIAIKGIQVTVVFDDVTPEVTLVKFRPAE